MSHYTEPDFYCDWVYKFRKIVGKTDFKKIVIRCKKIGYNMDTLNAYTACMAVNPIIADSVVSLFNCTTVGRSSD